MQKIKSFIAEKISKYLSEKGIEGIDVASLFSTPLESSMGDVALPCFKMAAVMKTSPVNIATELAGIFTADGVIEKAEAVKGYLNFFINKNYYKNL